MMCVVGAQEGRAEPLQETQNKEEELIAIIFRQLWIANS